MSPTPPPRRPRARAQADLLTLPLFDAPPSDAELCDAEPPVTAPSVVQAATAVPAAAPAAPAAPLDAAATLALLHTWTEAGWLRRLDLALAQFVAQHDPAASGPLLLATACLSQLEGHGHTCLPVASLLAQPQALLGWPAAGAQALAQAWPQCQPRLSDWRQALVRSRVVRTLGRDADLGQPLVWVDGVGDPADAPPLSAQALDGSGPRLYLRRYWDHERQVARQVRQRCAAAAPADPGEGQGASLRAELALAGPTPDTAVLRAWLDRLFPASAAPAEPADAAEARVDAMAATTEITALTAANHVNWQKLACAVALRGRLAVITGGPGTGKTYTAARLLALLLATADDPQRLRVALAAPTGKAAARLKQAIDSALTELQRQVGPGLDLLALTQRIGAARTLHALLGARPGTRAFVHNARQPLEVDVLIVDEASMVHLEMMAALLLALPPGARLVLLGDKDQLASVEAGAVLGDLCRDAQAGCYSPATATYAQAAAGITLPPAYLAPGPHAPALAQQTVMLRESRRFGGPIGRLAWAVNTGDARAARRELAAGVAGSPGAGPALARLEPASAEALRQLVLHGRPGAPGGYRSYLEVLAQRPPAGDAAAHRAWVLAVLTAFDRFRLLCAVREGEWGVAGLNKLVRQALASTRLLRPHGEWYSGRPVMVTRNDPALGVFNGDIGIALPGLAATTTSAQADLSEADEAAAPGSGAAGLRVWLRDGDELRSVGAGRLAQVETAFAMTVHKSQGSEFEHTVLVLPEQGGSVLSRELVYTGITRARQAFTLVSARAGALEEAMAQPTRRASGLYQALG